MCRSVYVTGRRCTCVGELAQAIGGSAYVVPFDAAPVELEDCLCQIDLEATAKHAGFTARVFEGFEVDDGFPGDWAFEQAAPRQTKGDR